MPYFAPRAPYLTRSGPMPARKEPSDGRLPRAPDRRSRARDARARPRCYDRSLRGPARLAVRAARTVDPLPPLAPRALGRPGPGQPSGDESGPDRAPRPWPGTLGARGTRRLLGPLGYRSQLPRDRDGPQGRRGGESAAPRASG